MHAVRFWYLVDQVPAELVFAELPVRGPGVRCPGRAGVRCVVVPGPPIGYLVDQVSAELVFAVSAVSGPGELPTISHGAARTAVVAGTRSWCSLS
jgi:hypothetical protein